MSTGFFNVTRPKSPIALDAPSSMFRPRSPTEISRDSGRPRSPTDASLCSRTRSIIRPRSPTTTSQVSITVPQGRSRTPTGLSEVSIHLPNSPCRSRSPTVRSDQSGSTNHSLPKGDTEYLSVMDAMRPRTPPVIPVKFDLQQKDSL